MAENELMIAKKRNEVVNSIEKTVSEYYGIDLSKNTQENAKKKQNIAMFVSKLVTTQSKKDKDGNTQPAILTASADSIRECALAYVNGDFDFFRNQAYLISYGNTIQFIVSKDGLVSGAKKLVKGLELFSDIVYKGDKFEYEKIGGRTLITKHEQPIENITCKIEDVVCAYATAWIDGKQVEAEIMTMQEITNALATAHRTLTDFHRNNPKIMLGKFPLRRLAKRIINQNVSVEVSRVLGDDEVYVEAESVEAHNEPVSINFEQKELHSQSKEIPTTKQVNENIKEEQADMETPFDNNYVKFPDSVSIFDMMDKQEQEPKTETKTVSYAYWKDNKDTTLVGWRMVRDSYNSTSKTCEIEKVS